VTTLGERASHMARSLSEALRAAGVPEVDAPRIERAYVVAMGPRVARLEDDHHPAYLHPGRTALVLLRDVGPSAAPALASAILHESSDDDLRVPLEQVVREVGPEVADEIAGLPLPRAEDLAERLVTLDTPGRLAVLAERLDHLRHLHLRNGREAWPALHEEVRSIWWPVAERTHPRLATRYAHWVRTFARRLP